jgi:hypothetical protein
MAIDSDSVGVVRTEQQGNHDEPTKDSGSIAPGDVISLDQVDLALAAKMNLVNEVRLFRKKSHLTPTDSCRQLITSASLATTQNCFS